jgi:hypothetical protein
MAQTYKTPFTIQTGQVAGGTQSSFIVPVSISDARIKTIANGGHADNGNDIRPYSDASLATPLTYVKEFYDGVNGIWIGWVLVNAVDGLVIYFGYGDSALTSDGSSNAVWPTQYKQVLLMPDGSTLNLNDSTSNARNGTAGGSGPTAGTGLEDGGASFGANDSDTITIGSGAIPTTGSFSFAVKPSWASTDSVAHAIGLHASDAGGTALIQGLKYSDNKLYCGWINGGSDGRVIVNSGAYTLNQNAWNIIDLTWDSAAPATKLYLNGTQIGSTNTTNGTWNTAGRTAEIGHDPNSGFSARSCVLDVTQLSDTVISQDWITTKYNALINNSAFWSMGAEVAVGAGSGFRSRIGGGFVVREKEIE